MIHRTGSVFKCRHKSLGRKVDNNMVSLVFELLFEIPSLLFNLSVHAQARSSFIFLIINKIM